ncbi:hypothetical protein [Sphingomonas panacis]|uniref:hypothetical protein n=1 Tax=Sphingomonas panacis TaxID=1560345 RepID=UPI00147148F4|nr:hypothetical protein [Sphingomonas panacis]
MFDWHPVFELVLLEKAAKALEIEFAQTGSQNQSMPSLAISGAWAQRTLSG